MHGSYIGSVNGCDFYDVNFVQDTISPELLERWVNAAKKEAVQFGAPVDETNSEGAASEPEYIRLGVFEVRQAACPTGARNPEARRRMDIPSQDC